MNLVFYIYILKGYTDAIYRVYVLALKVYDREKMNYKESKVFENRDYLISYIENEVEDIAYNFQNDLIQTCCYNHTTKTTTCYEVCDLTKLIKTISVSNPVPKDMKISLYLSEKYNEMQKLKDIYQTTLDEKEVIYSK